MSKTKLKRTIARVGYAPMQYNAETEAYTYGTVKWFAHNEAGGREFSAEANGENTEIYADGVVIYSSAENNGYDITLTVVRVIDDIDIDWLGNVIDDDGNTIEVANNVELPRFALFVIEETTDGIGITHCYYNCSVTQRPANGGATSEGSGFDPQFLEVSIAARPLPDSKVVYKRINAMEMFTTVPSYATTALAYADVTGGTLSAPFRSDVTEYTVTPTGTTGSLEFAPAIPTNDIVAVYVGSSGAGTTDLASGEEFDWEDVSVITVTVRSSGAELTAYTFTVSNG